MNTCKDKHKYAFVCVTSVKEEAPPIAVARIMTPEPLVVIPEPEPRETVPEPSEEQR